jgi:sugar/nucleoside kinase (ribokinase family)
MCSPKHRDRFSLFEEAGVDVVYLPSQRTTSIRNTYPTDNPDDRLSAVITRARPFSSADLEDIPTCDVIHINALWAGEFPSELIRQVKSKAGLVTGDAQGFVRHVDRDGALVSRDWPDKTTCLQAFDIFKVDINEARVLTGLDDRHSASRKLHEMGASVVVLTHRGGVCVTDGDHVAEAAFGPYPLEGRTGRGDTCMAAFVVARANGDLDEATARAAEITTQKLQYPEPFRGER